MRYTQPDQPEPITVQETTEERLRKEVEDLKRQLREQKGLVDGTAHSALKKPWHPSAITIWALFLGAVVLIVMAFFAGYIPLQKRNALIGSQAQEQEQAVPRVEVIEVGRSSPMSELQLPGNIEAVTEAPILARADGYIKRRMVDIGDRVQAGQPLAEIEAPELDQQLLQAKANLQQTQAALDQAQANEAQGKANLELAKVTASRWASLVAAGVVSKQDNDQYQSQYQAQLAGVQALEKAIAVQRANIAAAEANVTRLDQMQAYRVVKAPFAGVITLRNVDVGALVNSGSTLLYRIAQTGTLRTYVNVPQTNASSIHLGQPARLTVTNLPGRTFTGIVARTANSLDPSSRTMLVEVQVPNADGALLPGMYAQVDLSSPRANAPLLIPGDALIVLATGTQVAIVRPDSTVHLQKIQVGRDYGDRLEVLSGLQMGDKIIANPGDSAREGVKVEPVTATKEDQ
ncbi:MAG: efflux RND transporter periplasmic adaptor subunit [Acidobacteriota bacterium]|nr:efflux RND transporter periplasmic adaptor subunit [Acidobacteriota bacterium]